MAKRAAAIAIRRAPSVPKKKYEMAQRMAAAKGKRAREIAAKRTGTIVGAVAGGTIGYLERTGKISPKFTSPVALGVAGVVLAFVAPETSMGKGKLGAALAEAGSAALAVAAYKAGQGQPMIGEDIVGDDGSVEGEWSDG